jgi:hypothetical protein
MQLATLAALAAVAAAPSAADAAGAPMKQRFSLTVEGSQVTTWKRPPRAWPADCVPLSRTSGQGDETVRIRTTRSLRLTAHRLPGGYTGLTLDSRDVLGARVAATVRRRAKEQAEEMGCDTGHRITELGPYDCGTRDRKLKLMLLFDRRRGLGVETHEPLVRPLTKIDYETCPIHVAKGVTPNGFTTIFHAIPMRDLLDRRIGKHIIIARKTFRGTVDGVQTRTTVRWTMTLRRLKG